MKHLLYLSILLVIVACSPQVTEPLDLPKPEAPRVQEEPTITANPCITFDELDPMVREDVENAYVIYRDYLRAQEYEQAYETWSKAFYASPAANGRVQYQFDDGIRLYKRLLRDETVETEQQALLDSVFNLYDKWMECFPEDASTIKGKKAFNAYYSFRGRLTDTEIYSLFKEAFDGKEEPDYFIINPFSKLLFDHVVTQRVDYEEGRKYALSIMDIVAKNLSECDGKECETWEIINDYAPDLLSSLEGLEDFYPCEYFSDKYYPEYEADPTNCDVITDTYRKLRYGKCDLNDPRMLAIKSAFEQNCYVAPPSRGPLKLGLEALNAGRFKEAVSHYDEYINGADDLDKKAEIQLRIAKIYYVHIKNFPQARKYALAAAQTKANWGAPYMLIGKLYASSGPLCGPGRGWDSQIVTWPAIDKFEYAKRIDPSVSPEANKLINQYRQYMPSKEDIFQRRLKRNDSFKVPCWIQENTKVRPAG